MIADLVLKMPFFSSYSIIHMLIQFVSAKKTEYNYKFK